MENDAYEIRLNLTSLDNAVVKDLNTDKGMVKCLVIPISSHMKISKMGRVFMNFIATPMSSVDSCGYTHCIKRKINKEEFLTKDKSKLNATLPKIGVLKVKDDFARYKIVKKIKDKTNKSKSFKSNDDVDIDSLPF